MSDRTEHWDDEVDLLVLGTGAGGLAAAVTGANEGLSTLVLEKTEFVGGTTAYSAGTCWIPGTRPARRFRAAAQRVGRSHLLGGVR
jgi:3-oxosteroid 1-dehydrogenase